MSSATSDNENKTKKTKTKTKLPLVMKHQDSIPLKLRHINSLTENLNPIEEENSFGNEENESRPPFSGFDQDTVKVPQTKQR